MQVARALKALRERRKLSIEQLAERAHIPAVRISKLETAELSPRLSELIALARVFRLLPSTILRRAAGTTSRSPKPKRRADRVARRS
jgi:transcriptional regulator with XRE-family HTH domain